MSGERRDCACPRSRHEHGTLRAYASDRCRCFHCRVAHARATAAYRRGQSLRVRRLPAIGPRRRLRALYAAGWTFPELGKRLGVTKEAVRTAAVTERAYCLPAFADRIAALYDDLALTVPVGWEADRARRRAARLGWLPPLAYDDDRIDDPDYQPAADVEPDDVIDEVAVHRLMVGALKVGAYQRLPERVEAIRRLAQQGFSDGEIGARIGQTKEAVSKHRTRNSIPSGIPHGRTA